jgi:hypothetical protein
VLMTPTNQSLLSKTPQSQTHRATWAVPLLIAFRDPFIARVGVASPSTTASHLLQLTPWTYSRSTSVIVSQPLVQNPAQQFLPFWAQQWFCEHVRQVG